MNTITKTVGPVRFMKKSPTIITLMGEVDTDMVSKFVEEFNVAVASGQPVIPLIIHSDGGDLYDAIYIINCLKTATVPIATIVTGQAYSAAALIFSAGTEGYRFMAKNASIMLHDVGIEEVSGKCNDIEVEAEELRRTNRMVYRIMAENTGKRHNFFLNKVRGIRGADLYVDSAQALRWNLANVVGVPQLVTTVHVKMQLTLGDVPLGQSAEKGFHTGEGDSKRRRVDEDDA
jgi:ATP-dependent protease ClpP protease subunit